MRKKLVIIGAGSAMFTQGIVMDMINKNPGGHKWHLALVDIDEHVLDGVSRLVKKLFEKKQADIELSWSTDRKDVLPGADYVVSTISVGGRRAWEQDVFIPRKYGINQPVGDTALPGGISRAMRMVPAILEIVKDVEKLCPNAYFFNYSNPMAIICRAVRKANYPITGLCIGTVDTEWSIARFMGYDRSRVTSLAAGINHCTFMYDFRYDGENAWPAVRRKLEEVYGKTGDCDDDIGSRIVEKLKRDSGGKPTDSTFFMGEPFAWSFFMRYGAFPAPGDRHVTEFFPEYFPGGRYYGYTLGHDVYSFERAVAMGDQIHNEAMEKAFSPEPLDDDFFKRIGGEHEQFTSIVDSIERDKREIYYMNVQNNGAIPNLPPWAVVEMPVLATATGPKPIILNDYPDVLASFTAKFLSVIEVTVDAALKGDRQLMEEAILAGGYISGRKAVVKMVDELIKAQINYLPQFR
ncbi:MAG: hypothetical protein GX754_02575 [Clostridiaceae bacterium]|nr:hypothetical protein [Clostridiaceae bacterium]